MRHEPISSSDIVFLGDSLTEAFDLRHYLGLPNLRNRGLSGDSTSQVLYRLEEIVNARPARLFLMIGINDLFQGEDEVTIFQNILRILDRFRESSPETILCLQSILPVNESVMLSDDDINLFIFSLNDSLKQYCRKTGILFIDLYGNFLNKQGEMDRKYTYDGVHLTPEGYALWAELVQPFLIHLINPKITMQTIGVTGAGVIGSSLAQHIADTGLNVLLVDLSAEKLEAARSTIQRNRRLSTLLRNRDDGAGLETPKGSVSFLTDISEMAGADFIVECVTEKLDIKREVFMQLDRFCGKNCVIATNTSAIPVRQLAEFTGRQDRVVGLHFMNPVALIGAVEMISSPLTSESTLETTRQFLTLIRKDWIHVNDFPGFVSNRILMLTVNEAIATLEDGVAPAGSIDKIFRSCFNHKMGPLETADLIGLDTILYTLEVLEENFGDKKFTPSLLLRTMVEAGQLGRKSGKGFYDYNSEI